MLTAEQLIERRCGIGSSDIAAVCGLSSWASPIDVWLSKTGRSATERTIDELQFAIGHALEPVIAERYSYQTGEELLNPQVVLRSQTCPWQLASPDRLRTSDGRPVECKVAYSSAGWGDAGSDEVPQEYICQVQWQLDVSGADWAHLAAIVGRSFQIYTIRRDDELLEALREAAQRFWTDYVLGGVQPPVSGHERDKMYLQQRFAEYESKMLKADGEQDLLAARLHSARGELAAAEHEVELYSNQMREAIGESEGIQGDGWKCTWKAPKPTNKVDWEAVARDLGVTPDLILKHTRQQQNSRRFLFTQKGTQ